MKRWQIGGAAAVFLLLVMAVAGGLTEPVYYLNDDVTIRYILSGACTGIPDSHGVQMKYPLTWVLAALYKITGGLQVFVPWFDLFMAGCILLAGTGILAGCLEASEKKTLSVRVISVLVGILLFVGLLLPHYLYMHYTIVAAMLAGSALFSWGAGQGRLLPILMLGLCYMVRSEVFLLALPFLLVAVLDTGLREAGRPVGGRQIFAGLCRAIKRQGRSLLVLICMVLILWGIDLIGYGSREWRDYREYYHSRLKLYDYTDFQSTDRYEEHYEQLGLDWGQYQVLVNYDTLLDNSIDAQLLEQVESRIREMQEPVAAGERIRQYLKSYYLHMRYDGVPYGLVWAGCCALVLILMIFHKRWDRLLLWAALLLGRSMIWIYLIARDRFPERIWLSLYLIETGLLLGMLLWECCGCQDTGPAPASKEKTGMRRLPIGCMVLCMVLVGCAMPMQLRQTLGNVRIQQARQAQWELLVDQLSRRDADLYLMDVYSSVAYAGKVYERDCEQIMLLGGWMTQCPLIKQRLASFGAEDGVQALEHPRVRLLVARGRDISWLEEYLSNRLGQAQLEAQEIIAFGEDAEFVEYRLINTESQR